MASISFRQGSIGFVTGLGWDFVRGEHALGRVLRDRARDLQADKCCVIEHAGQVLAGVGAVDDFDLGDGSAKGVRTMHSLAAVVAQFVWSGSAHVEAENVVVVLKLGDAQEEGEGRCAVVVLDAGMPVLDEFRSFEESRQLIADYMSGSAGFSNYRVLVNDLVRFPGDLLDVEALWGHASKQSQLKAPPVDLRKLLMTCAAVSVLAGMGAWYSLSYVPAREAEKVKAAKKAADPLPKYQAALAGKITALGVKRDAMLAILDKLKAYPLYSDGWLLDGVECEQGQCVSNWVRRGGKLDGLLAHRPGESLASGGFSSAKLSFAVPMDLFGVSSALELLAKDKAVLQSTSVYQQWEYAGIGTQGASGGYVGWPSGDYNVSEIPDGIRVDTQNVEFSVPFPLAAEVIKTAPADVYWQSMRLTVAQGDAAQALMIVLKGVSYVH